MRERHVYMLNWKGQPADLLLIGIFMLRSFFSFDRGVAKTMIGFWCGVAFVCDLLNCWVLCVARKERLAMRVFVIYLPFRVRVWVAPKRCRGIILAYSIQNNLLNYAVYGKVPHVGLEDWIIWTRVHPSAPCGPNTTAPIFVIRRLLQLLAV